MFLVYALWVFSFLLAACYTVVAIMNSRNFFRYIWLVMLVPGILAFVYKQIDPSKYIHLTPVFLVWFYVFILTIIISLILFIAQYLGRKDQQRNEGSG